MPTDIVNNLLTFGILLTPIVGWAFTLQSRISNVREMSVSHMSKVAKQVDDLRLEMTRDFVSRDSLQDLERRILGEMSNISKVITETRDAVIKLTAVSEHDKQGTFFK